MRYSFSKDQGDLLIFDDESDNRDIVALVPLTGDIAHDVDIAQRRAFLICEALDKPKLVEAAPQMLEALKAAYEFMLMDNDGDKREHEIMCICDGDDECGLCKAALAIHDAEGGGS